MALIAHLISNPEQVWDKQAELTTNIDYGILREDPMALNKTRFAAYMRAKAKSIYLLEHKQVGHDEAIGMAAIACTDLIDRWKVAAKAKATSKGK